MELVSVNNLCTAQVCHTKKTLREGLKTNEDWESEFFYVNTFLPNDDVPYSKNSSN